jgi:hypothetical protein
MSPGIGDFSADPLLADRKYGNLHVLPGSPCADAGWNEAPGIPAMDMDGQPRIQGGRVDIGADESDGTAWSPGPYAIVRVSPEGDDANDGSSWALSKRSVQAAMDSASILGGDVWVKSGTYGEHVELRVCAYVYGGFMGTEGSRSERSFNLNSTVLDGNGSGPIVTCRTGLQMSAIDGFTIRNAYAATVDGGGVYCRNSSPTIANNKITGNDTSERGGGIYCYYASPTIANNVIAGNSATHGGGGIYCSYGPPAIVNNTITANSSSFPTPKAGGGGINCWESSPMISNNIIAFNSKGIYRSGGTPVLRNNCVYGNSHYDYYSSISAGVGDTSVDPLFVNRTGGDYHLTLQSPCINAGLNKSVSDGWLDIDGEPRVLPAGGTVDIGADEYGVHTVCSPDDARRLVPDGQEVYLLRRGTGMIVTAILDSMPAFYVEQPDRASGIQCRGSLLDPGQTGIIYGTMDMIDGERALVGASVIADSLTTATVPDPLSMVNRSVGGGSAGLQQGVSASTDPNNIGLLICTTGRVAFVGADYFYLDDGSGVVDRSGHTGVKVLASGLSLPDEGDYARVTAISSCFEEGGELYRLIRVRTQADIVVFD